MTFWARRHAKTLILRRRRRAPVTETTAATTPPNEQNSRVLAAVAYILTFVTGLIIYFVAPKEDKYARWHAIQAIGLGIAWIVLSILVNILDAILPLFGILSMLLGLTVLIAIIVLAVKAYQGEKLRLPIIAEMADKNA